METNLKRINFHDQYKVDGYRSKDHEVVKTLDSNRMGAAELCSKSGHKLFLVRPEYDLNAIFSKYSVTRVWVDLHYSKTYDVLLDVQNRYPVPLAANSVRVETCIEISSNMSDDRKIALELKDRYLVHLSRK
jgi:hypothetical protein